MGKGGNGRGKWQDSWASQQGSYSLWKGTWPKKNAEKDWDPKKIQFPRYDEKRAGMGGNNPSSGSRGEEDGASEPSFVQGFQECVNLARKAEMRVKSLTSTRKQKVALWHDYVAQMKKTWQQEHNRHLQNLARLDEDISAAFQQQEDARAKLCMVASQQMGTREKEETETDELWDQLTSEWDREESQQNSAGAVLERALQSRTRGTGSAPRSAPGPVASGLAAPGPSAPTEPLSGKRPHDGTGLSGSGLTKPDTVTGEPSGLHTEPTYSGEAVIPPNPYHASPNARQTSMSPLTTSQAHRQLGRPRASVKTHTKPEIKTGSTSFQERLDIKRQQLAATQALVAEGGLGVDGAPALEVRPPEDPDLAALASGFVSPSGEVRAGIELIPDDGEMD
eukprot:s2814_g4.t1